MIDVKRDFQQRVDEIDLYFNFLEKIARRTSSLALGNGRTESIDPSIAKIMRANGFLLLYNLVESSIKKSVEEIYASIRRNNRNYDQIKDGLRRDIINYLRSDKISTDKFILEVANIANDIVERCFSADRLFSGNIDAKKIRELGGSYGFSTRTDRRSTRDGSSLLIVKTRRNGLAHGDYSFQDCGKDYSMQDMLKTKKQVVAYTKRIIDNIEQYILREEYLR